MNLLELVATMEGGQRTRVAKPDPEAVCSVLRELAARYARPNPFKPGDLITACEAGDVKGVGEPHIVLETRERPDPDFNGRDSASNAYGRRTDIRIASVCGRDIAPFWVESWQFEPYTGTGSEAPAV